MNALTLLKPLLLVLLFPFLASRAPGQETRRRVDLKHGLSLEVPVEWSVQPPPQIRKDLERTRETLTEKAGIEKPRQKKEELLAVNSTPAPAGAMIRLSVSSPARFAQADLSATGPAGLSALRSELVVTFKKLEAAGGPKVRDVQIPLIEQINDHLAVCIVYLRAGAPGMPPWEVKQYKIPVNGRLVELTLSHRQTEEAEWKLVLEQVKRSLRFPGGR
ncbi:MAG TPA: hypothetical protein VIE90_04090 [Candidatus Binatia bacterium]|jgi:hypothetical protein